MVWEWWGEPYSCLLCPEDQLETSGRPVIDEAFLNDARFLCWKGRHLVPRREALNFCKMGGGLCPALCSTVKMIVNQQKGCGVGQVGIPARLAL